MGSGGVIWGVEGLIWGYWGLGVGGGSGGGGYPFIFPPLCAPQNPLQVLVNAIIHSYGL